MIGFWAETEVILPIQVCESMRQAIAEVFEAGFVALENMVLALRPDPRAPPSTSLVGAGFQKGVQGLRAQNLGELQHGIANLHLKHSTSMPNHMYNPMAQQDYPAASRHVFSPLHCSLCVLPDFRCSTLHLSWLKVQGREGVC